MTTLTETDRTGNDQNETLTTVWELLRTHHCYRQTIRKKTRVVWWPRENIFPHRTDFVRMARLALPRPRAKQILAAVRRLDACTLPWAPPLETIDAADNAMFTEGDRYNIDMQVRRDILVDVLHMVPHEITPQEITAFMRHRFSSLHGKGCIMTEKAAGFTYEQMVAAGWNADTLVQHGYARES